MHRGTKSALVLTMASVGLVAASIATGGGGLAAQQAGTDSHYSGVTPGSSTDPPLARRAKRIKARRGGPGHVLTWVGLHARLGGGSRFFIQLSDSLTPRASAFDDRFEVVLPDTGIHLRNTRRPLETRFFNTPVTRVRTEKRERDMALIFELREALVPTVSAEPGAGGYFYVYVDFPEGDWVDEPMPMPENGPEGRPEGRGSRGDSTRIRVYGGD